MAARLRVAVRMGSSSNFEAMSDEEVVLPRGAAAVTEPEDVSGEEMEGATKIRFRNKSTWKQINLFTVDGKSETDISNLIFESAKDHFQPWRQPRIFVLFLLLTCCDTSLFFLGTSMEINTFSFMMLLS